MEKPNICTLGMVVCILLLPILLNSCEDRFANCGGAIVVENPIPDTTLYVGGEPFKRDISDPPVVFRHTEDEISVIIVVAVDNGIAGAGTHLNQGGKAYVVYVEARKKGNTEIRVTAEDECPDYRVTTTFNVTVIDTTNS